MKSFAGVSTTFCMEYYYACTAFEKNYYKGGVDLL